MYDFSKLATIILVLGLITHYFFYSALVVRGQSMEPSFHDGQVLAVSKISYQIGNPERGDIVAMFFPGETDKRFIKRVIGLPGETVVVSDGLVYINGQALPEAYLPSGQATVPELTRLLGQDEYFVLGDNRSNSSDSRAWGPVPESFIVGKASARLFSVGADESLAH
ncbi:MAG: signal peptidase I [Patescibacteria group bacterium]